MKYGLELAHCLNDLNIICVCHCQRTALKQSVKVLMISFQFPKTIFGFEWSKKFDIDIKEIGVTEDDLRAAFTGDDVLDAKQLEALLKNSAKKHTLKLDTIFVDTLSRCGYIFEHKYANKKEEFRFAILQAILYYRLINRLAKLKLRRIVFFAINYLPKPDINGDRCQVEIFVYEVSFPFIFIIIFQFQR